MRLFFSFILLLLIRLPLFSQEFKIGLQSGWGNYKMAEMKSLNDDIILKNPLHPRIISNYPSFYYNQPTIIFAYKKVNFGFLYSYQTTGSRLSIKDYSGEYRFDTKINSGAFGILGEINLIQEKKIKIIIYTELGIFFTRFIFNEYLKVNYQTLIDNEILLKSKNSYFEPGIKISYPISFISIEFNLGYCNQFGKGNLEVKENESLSINGKKIKPDWSGLRYGLSVFIVTPF